MPRDFRKRPTYFTVFALKDGTICAALEERRPSRRRGHRRPSIDEDGCFRWRRTDATYPAGLSDSNRIILQVAIVNSLNTKKAIREQVEKRLERIERQLTKILDALAPGGTLND